MSRARALTTALPKALLGGVLSGVLCGILAAAVLGCSGISELGAGGDSGPVLAADEQAAVRGQVERASAARRWKIAWNLEIAAGADHAALEQIALEALHGRSSHAGDMLTSLRKRWGDLGPKGRARVDGWVAAARSGDLWARALELELLSADDPPKYAQAWAVYRAAPVDRSEELLDGIKSAREDFADEDSAGENPAGENPAGSAK